MANRIPYVNHMLFLSVSFPINFYALLETVFKISNLYAISVTPRIFARIIFFQFYDLSLHWELFYLRCIKYGENISTVPATFILTIYYFSSVFNAKFVCVTTVSRCYMHLYTMSDWNEIYILAYHFFSVLRALL